MTPGIVISYRPDDTDAQARRLYEFLIRRFGEDRVALDVRSLIRPGDDYVDAIEQGVRNSLMLLVLIGASWLGDWVNDSENHDVIAIRTALTEGKKVIPIVINNATMPVSADLGELNSLTRRGRMMLNDDDFRTTAAQIADATGMETVRTAPNASLQQASAPTSAESLSANPLILNAQAFTKPPVKQNSSIRVLPLIGGIVVGVVFFIVMVLLGIYGTGIPIMLVISIGIAFIAYKAFVFIGNTR